MDSFPLLSVITFLPLAGAVLIALLARGGDCKTGVKISLGIGFVASLATLGLSAYMLHLFDPANTGFQFVERAVWIPAFNIAYIKGIDGISVWFAMLTALLTPVGLLSIIGGVKTRAKEFVIALLVLETMLLGVFTSLDLILFYAFFEGVLIPMFIIVGAWGQTKTGYAAYKSVLYTLLGSLLMLVAIFVTALNAGTTDMTALIGNPNLPPHMALWLFLAFFVSFAIKTPIWPFHTWLPYVYEETPAAFVVMSGVMLKMGSYGFIRIGVQMLPHASTHFAPMVIWLSLIGIVYASLAALAQTEMKRVIAYSSLAHMGYITLGIFSFTDQGFDGAMFVALSHSLVAAALFLGVSVPFERLGITKTARYGGMANNMPRYAALFMVFTLASVGLPGTSGFIGEFLTTQGAYLANSWYGVIAATGMVLGAAYMLVLYRGLFFGPSDKPDVAAMKDVNVSEMAMFAPLLILVLWLGIHPADFRHIYAPTLDKVISDYQAHIQGDTND